MHCVALVYIFWTGEGGWSMMIIEHMTHARRYAHSREYNPLSRSLSVDFVHKVKFCTFYKKGRAEEAPNERRCIFN